MKLTETRTSADAGPAGPGEDAADSLADGVASYRVVDELDATGRMTLRTTDGVELTVVDCIDGVARKRLADRARGATVRAELSPAANGEGYVAARVRPGALPSL